MTVVGISHSQQELNRYFLDDDLARLRSMAQVRILGGNARELVLPQLHDIEILIGSWGMPRLDAELLRAAPKLKAICYAAGSVKGFVTPESYARDILVTTAAYANAVSVAEVTVALITLANKAWFQSHGDMRQGKYRQDIPHCGNFGSTIGLIGLGAIGRLVASKLSQMDVTVLAYDPYARTIPAGVECVDELVSLARRSDVVSLHAADIPANEGMLDQRFFKAMRDQTTFINTARGRLVNERALIAELETGRLYAHLDVTFPEPPLPSSPLLRLPNVWLTPHISGSTHGEIRRMGRVAIEECLALLAGRPLRYQVHQEMLASMA